jgi:hypothetical protein
MIFMKYQIGFDGSASAELTQLLQAVERQINGLATGILAQMDAQAQPASSASTAQPCDPSSANCSSGSSGSGGHDAVIIVVTAVVAGAVGYVAGKKSADQVKSPKV